MIAKIYPNAIFILVVLVIASVCLSAFADATLAKSAFIGATALAAGSLTMGMTFLQGMKAKGLSWIGAFNFNVWVCVVACILVLAAVFGFQDVSVFTDSVFEAIVGSTVAGGVGLALAFAKKDDE